MSVLNKRPNTLVINTSIVGFSKVRFFHNQASDFDATGVVFKLTGDTVDRRYSLYPEGKVPTFTDVSPVSGTTTFSGAFYDSLLAAVPGALNQDDQLDFSQELTLDVINSPNILDAQVVAEPVDVGIGPSYIHLVTDSQSPYEVQLEDVSNPGVWVTYGLRLTQESTIYPPLAEYNVRIRGVVDFGGGEVEYSGYDTWPDSLDVANVYVPPSKPDSVTFKWHEIRDGNQRFDLKVNWEWEKLTGSNVRTFLVFYRRTGQVDWSTMSSGAGTRSAILNSFPHNVGYEFKVRAVSWGPDGDNFTDSDIVTYTLDPTNTTDREDEIFYDTYIEYNLDKLAGYSNIGGTKTETFKVSSDGSANFGSVDGPNIQIDPVTGFIHADGGVITNSIYSANFILSNLTGNMPALYSQQKPEYGDPSQGIWMGHTDNTTFKLDIGDDSNFLRWDGSKLYVKGTFEVDGGGSLGNQIYYQIAEPSNPNVGDLWVLPPGTYGEFADPELWGDPETWIDYDENVTRIYTEAGWEFLGTQTGTDALNEAEANKEYESVGFYTQNIDGFSGVFNISEAVNYFTTYFPTDDGLFIPKWSTLTQQNTLDRTIRSTKLWDGTAWTSPSILANGDIISDGTIVGNKLVANTIEAGHIAANTITANEIATNTLTANEITANTITANEIQSGTIQGDNINATTRIRVGSGSGQTYSMLSGVGAYSIAAGASSDSDGSDAPFRVTPAGVLYASSGTFGGTLQAAGGVFTGTLSGVGGTFTGTIEANQIVGDLYKALYFSLIPDNISDNEIIYTVTVDPLNRDTTIIFPIPDLYTGSASGGDYTLEILYNSISVIYSRAGYIPVRPGATYAYYTKDKDIMLFLPTGSSGTYAVRVNFSGSGGLSSLAHDGYEGLVQLLVNTEDGISVSQ